MMISTTRIIGLLLPVIIAMNGTAAHAAESASFRLYNTNPNYASGGPKDSTSFSMNEDGATFIAQPTASSNYQIVTAPPVASSASSSSTSSSEESADTGGGDGGGGGRRGHETEVGRPRFPGSVSEQPTPEPDRPSAPETEPEPEVDEPTPPADIVRQVLETPRQSLAGLPSQGPAFFDTVDAPWCACDCALRAAAPDAIPGIRVTIAIIFMAASYLLGALSTFIRQLLRAMHGRSRELLLPLPLIARKEEKKKPKRTKSTSPKKQSKQK